MRSAEMIQKMLENELRTGWEFFDIKTIKVPTKKGFLRSASEKDVSLIFFRRQLVHNMPKMKEDKQGFNSISTEQMPSLGPAKKD